ncbi:phage structural protein [Ligilactobacillus equi]|uniref:DUF3277 domain-containing protein n=1 Tax=Ligilactobacillus equi DSM 15833 = JCM 10991 TaxID=1423740 RepID=A0A0R1TKT8_9LACO|nr:hypothetical protein [Ligilactobacillus equi]KRL81808.1 hypothetical protein FC36_GL001403 [Ligilactobacillus equi DSM 15833 = JCM 10991]
MSLEYIYNAKDVHISVDGRVVQGFQDGDMFTAQVKEDRVQTEVDAQGEPSVAINNNRLGQVTVNLSGNSADHKRLNKLANTSKVFPLVITTPYEKITCDQCIIARPAEAAFGKQTPKRTYTIEALDLHVEVL